MRVRVRGRSSGVLLFVACTALPLSYFGTLREIWGFDIRDIEPRYATIGEYAARALPANAAIITVLHSGSLSLYGRGATARWDWLSAGRLDEAVAILDANGYVPYILLEQSEGAALSNEIRGDRHL